MTQERYIELCNKEGAIQLHHPEFDAQEYHRNLWAAKDVTIAICQRKTKEFTQLCVESILRFYPDIQILVIDGDSQDDSTLYLRYKALKVPNLKVYERIGQRHSHGFTLDDAIMNHITTAFVLPMDSDTIVNRGGWVEGMLDQFMANPKLYATGSLMLVSHSNYGVGAPKDDNDILRYAHPSCALFHVPTYRELDTQFNDNGSPLAHNMLAAEKAGLQIGAFPIDKYVSHRMGVSWVKEHQIIWKDDYDVFIRPFITFIVTLPEHFALLQKQSDKDFNVVLKDKYTQMRIWESEGKDISNQFYGIRYMINGEYVCLLNEAVSDIVENFVHLAKVQIIENKAPLEINVGGIRLADRKFFQKNDSLA